MLSSFIPIQTPLDGFATLRDMLFGVEKVSQCNKDGMSKESKQERGQRPLTPPEGSIPLTTRPTMNIPESTEPAQIAAPTMRTAAANWIVLLRENLSAQYAEHAAPIADPAELTPVYDQKLQFVPAIHRSPLKAPMNWAVLP